MTMSKDFVTYQELLCKYKMQRQQALKVLKLCSIPQVYVFKIDILEVFDAYKEWRARYSIKGLRTSLQEFVDSISDLLRRDFVYLFTPPENDIDSAVTTAFLSDRYNIPSNNLYLYLDKINISPENEKYKRTSNGYFESYMYSPDVIPILDTYVWWRKQVANWVSHKVFVQLYAPIFPKLAAAEPDARPPLEQLFDIPYLIARYGIGRGGIKVRARKLGLSPIRYKAKAYFTKSQVVFLDAYHCKVGGQPLHDTPRASIDSVELVDIDVIDIETEEFDIAVF